MHLGVLMRPGVLMQLGVLMRLVAVQLHRTASVALATSALAAMSPWSVAAQEAAPATAAHAQHDGHAAPTPNPTDPHAGHDMGTMSSLFPGRTGSGTSWLPERTRMIGVHARSGAWSVMLMGNAYLQYLNEVAPIHRGAHQAGSVNWLMAMARRPAGRGWTGLRLMASAEPFTIGGCGYPVALATGERCDGDTIHDRQHQHDLFMEMAGEYDRPVGRGLRWHVYGGPVGEPALGPTAFPHRQSALINPLAPVTHHWLDATHVTFGVVTSGISGARWRAEASAFNGREPDERRTNFDFGPMDSVSARFAVRPTDAVSIQVSSGRLESAEPAEAGHPAIDVVRTTASLLYQGTLRGRATSAALAWGTNAERRTRTHAMLAEAVVALTDTRQAFARAELSGKTAHDLHVHELADDTVLTVGKLQGGLVQLFATRRGVQAGVGASVSAAFVPAVIRPNYGGVAMGVGVFALVRPSTP